MPFRTNEAHIPAVLSALQKIEATSQEVLDYRIVFVNVVNMSSKYKDNSNDNYYCYHQSRHYNTKNHIRLLALVSVLATILKSKNELRKLGLREEYKSSRQTCSL